MEAAVVCERLTAGLAVAEAAVVAERLTAGLAVAEVTVVADTKALREVDAEPDPLPLTDEDSVG